MPELNEKSAKQLWDRVDSAWKWKIRTFQKRAERDFALYSGDHYGEYYEGDLVHSGFKCVTHNITATDIEIAHSLRTFQPPTFGVRPRKPMLTPEGIDDDVTPQLIARRIEEDFVDSGAWASVQDAYLNQLVFGLGATLTGWDFGQEDPTLGVPKEMADQYSTMAQNPMIDAGDLEMPTLRAGEGPRTVSVLPYDFIYPPETESWNWADADFLGRFYTVSTDELKRTKLPGTEDLAGYADPIRVVRSGPGPTDRYPDDFKSYGDSTTHAYSVLAEIWFRKVYLDRGYTDRDTGVKYKPGVYPLRVLWCLEKTNKYLKCEVWPYDFRDKRGKRIYPFRVFVHRKPTGRLQGQGMAEIAEPQQREINAERSVVATIADEAARIKYEVNAEAITTEGIQALQERLVGALVRKKVGPGMEGPSIGLVQAPTVGQAAELMGEHAIRDLNANTGVDEAAQGLAIAGVHTATEANLVSAKSGTRNSKSDREFQEHLAAIADMQWQARIQFGHPGEPVTVPLPDYSGDAQPSTIPMDMDHLRPVQVTIVSGSTKQQDKQEHIQNVMAAIQVGTQIGEVATPQNPIGNISGIALMKRLLALMEIDDGSPGLYDTTRYKQQMAAMQQQAQASQMAQMVAGGGAGGEGAQASGGEAPEGAGPGGPPPPGLPAGPPPGREPPGGGQGPPIDPQMLQQLLGVGGGQGP